jgi:hypothetical protein
MIGDPENTYPVKEGKDDLRNGPVDAVRKHIVVQHLLQTFDIQVDHMSDELIDKSLLSRLRIRKRNYLAPQLLFAHLIDMGYLIPILVQQRDIQQGFQLLAAIIPDIGLGPTWPEKIIPLLPYTYRMGFDAGKILKILYREDIHTAILQERGNSCLRSGGQSLNQGGVSYQPGIQ